MIKRSLGGYHGLSIQAVLTHAWWLLLTYYHFIFMNFRVVLPTAELLNSVGCSAHSTLCLNYLFMNFRIVSPASELL